MLTKLPVSRTPLVHSIYCHPRKNRKNSLEVAESINPLQKKVQNLCPEE